MPLGAWLKRDRMHALIFGFLDFRTGQLDPGYAALAREACISIRSVARGLQNLKLAGVLNWVRRCAESWKDGRFALEQETNAYAILPASQWRGYREPPEAPPPQPGTWGDHPCGMRDPLTEADAEQRHGSGPEAVIRQLELGRGGGVGRLQPAQEQCLLATVAVVWPITLDDDAGHALRQFVQVRPGQLDIDPAQRRRPGRDQRIGFGEHHRPGNARLVARLH